MGTPTGTTLNEAAHPFTFLISEDSDGAGFLSRDEVVIGNSQSIVVGQILSRVSTVASAVVTATPAAGNTGNGVLTLANPKVGTDVLPGDYRIVFDDPATNLGSFNVYAPGGQFVGSGVVGTAFTGPVKFTIADGSADFVMGDSFTINVDVGGELSETYIAWAPGQKADAIAGYPAVTGASTTQRIAVINAHATVRLADLTFDGSPTTAQKDQAKRDLATKLIKFR